MFAINKHNIQPTVGTTRMIDIPCFVTIETSVNCCITHFYQILMTNNFFKEILVAEICQRTQ